MAKIAGMARPKIGLNAAKPKIPARRVGPIGVNQNMRNTQNIRLINRNVIMMPRVAQRPTGVPLKGTGARRKPSPTAARNPRAQPTPQSNNMYERSAESAAAISGMERRSASEKEAIMEKSQAGHSIEKAPHRIKNNLAQRTQTAQILSQLEKACGPKEQAFIKDIAGVVGEYSKVMAEHGKREVEMSKHIKDLREKEIDLLRVHQEAIKKNTGMNIVFGDPIGASLKSIRHEIHQYNERWGNEMQQFNTSVQSVAYSFNRHASDFRSHMQQTNFQNADTIENLLRLLRKSMG